MNYGVFIYRNITGTNSGQALGVPEGWGFQISRQSAHEGGKVVSPTHRPPLPQEIFLVLISVRGWVDSRAVVRLEGLCRWKIKVTPSVFEPATLRLVAQCLNQPRGQMLLGWLSSFEIALVCCGYRNWWILEMAFDTCTDCRPFGATRMRWIGWKQNSSKWIQRYWNSDMHCSAQR